MNTKVSQSKKSAIMPKKKIKPVKISATIPPVNYRLLTVRLHSIRTNQKSIGTTVAELKKEVAALRKELKNKEDKINLKPLKRIPLKDAKRIYENSPYFKKTANG